MKAPEELGEASETEAEITELREKIEDAGMPEEAAEGGPARARPAGASCRRPPPSMA